MVAEDLDLIVADVWHRIVAIGIAEEHDCFDTVRDTGGELCCAFGDDLSALTVMESVGRAEKDQ